MKSVILEIPQVTVIRDIAVQLKKAFKDLKAHIKTGTGASYRHGVGEAILLLDILKQHELLDEWTEEMLGEDFTKCETNIECIDLIKDLARIAHIVPEKIEQFRKDIPWPTITGHLGKMTDYRLKSLDLYINFILRMG